MTTKIEKVLRAGLDALLTEAGFVSLTNDEPVQIIKSLQAEIGEPRSPFSASVIDICNRLSLIKLENNLDIPKYEQELVGTAFFATRLAELYRVKEETAFWVNVDIINPDNRALDTDVFSVDFLDRDGIAESSFFAADFAELRSELSHAGFSL